MFYKKLFIFFLFLHSILANAETLFYKQNGAITPQEHEVLYKIMLETQFPMNLAYGKYVEDEIGEMNAKIKQRLSNSGIEAAFIPTTLYEMFCLNYLRDHFEQLKDATFGLIIGYFVKKNETEYITIARTSDELKAIAFNTVEFKQANINTNLIKWHLAINNFIIDQLKNSAILLPLSFEQALQCLKKIDFWHGKIEHRLRNQAPDRFTIFKKERNILVPRDMERAIAIEYQAYNTEKFVLYRGSIFTEYSDTDGSISFGATLLGGILFDYTACVYHLISQTSQGRFGYALFINKKEYAEGFLNNMFFIPPLITLLSLCGLGEFFHARTKVIDIDQEYIAGFFGRLKLKSKAPFYQIKANTRAEAEKIYKQMLFYINEHRLIFRDMPKVRL